MLRILFLSLALLTSIRASEIVVHVAPDGNDQWTGRSEERAAPNGPKRTLPAALKAAREARASAVDISRLLITLHDGRHDLAERVILTPADSGLSSQVPLEIAAAPGAKPILSGGRQITEWTRDGGNPRLWRAVVPWLQPGTAFRALFIGGRRATPARIPNDGFFLQDGDARTIEPLSFKFRGNDLRPEWANSGAELVALHKWIDLRHPITAVDSGGKIVTLAGNIANHVKEVNARYRVENIREALDAPGEWFLDATNRALFYIARDGEDMRALEVIAPLLEGPLVHLQGDHARGIPVRNVSFCGLTFAHTNWKLPPTGYYDTQAAVKMRGELLAEGAVDCVVEQCEFTALAGYGLELGLGCQNWLVHRNTFHDLGAGGIRLGEARRLNPTSYEANHGHQVLDNELRQLGRMFPAAVGVFIQQSGRNLIAHNHIHDLYYTGISVGWNWGYQETPCRENRVEYNHIHHIGQGMLSDMGGIYTLGIQRGTMIRNNLIHDVTSHGYGGWGIYPDEGTSHILIESNIVHTTKSAGFHQHYGKENLVRNNIFALGKEHQWMRTREEAHTSFMLDRNIVLFDSGTGCD